MTIRKLLEIIQKIKDLELSIEQLEKDNECGVNDYKIKDLNTLLSIYLSEDI